MANGLRGLLRDFTPARRVELVEFADKKIGRRLIKGLIWDRLTIWRRYAIIAAMSCSAILLWGAELAERLERLLHALGLR